MRSRPTERIAAGAVLALALAACSSGGKQTHLSPAAERGRRTYLNVCTACHNADPTQPGSPGPAVAGASRALVAARVLHAAYPPGYTPKRKSHVMPAYPFLANRVGDLAAYLEEVGRAKKKTP